ncbi:DNA-binding CsgD family transcriptional regulator [Neorhizobium galegae]|uniref:hypothetical protein n=1 Tax=Neorhizobium galegae TaxID=399 RepID=UPI001AE6D3A8|nr:hypothetical protein [Neorhizobium galegae]MBP2563334.1 DNA-binding CsgD family transcriptional regulator [Neorhizobium galegae]
MIKLLQKIAKALASAYKTSKSLGRMGIRKAGNFSRAALGSFVNMFGGGGRFQPPEPAEEIETALDMSGLDEALAQLNADMDDENEAEFKAQHRALTEGREPKDIFDYTNADSDDKRRDIAKLMRKDTVTWVKEHLSDEQRLRIAKTSEDAVKYHISGVRPIQGVPEFPKNDMKNVAEFKPLEPADMMKAMGINVAKAMRVAEAADRDPLQNSTPVAGNSPRKPVKGKAVDEPEQDYDRGYAPQPGFARLR